MMYNESSQHEFHEPRRLHPVTIIIEVFTAIKNTIFGFGIGLIITLQESFIFFLIFLLLFIVGIIVYSIVSWLRFTYWIEGDELRVEQGVLIRRKRYLSVNRIHKIDLTANIVHRLFKLVEVQIDSASSSGEAEVYLTAVNVADAKKLRRALQAKKVVTNVETEVQEHVIAKQKISWQRLFIAGSTSGSAGIIILALLTLFSQIEELIPRNIFNQVYSWLIQLSVVFIMGFVLLLLFLLWLFGIAGTMLRYGHFTLEKRENELFIKRGLLETKELTIPFDRIQAIGIEQSPIRQPLGYVRVFAIVAGGSFDKLESYPVLFPILHKTELQSFLQTFLADYEILDNQPLKRVAKKGLKYYMLTLVLLPLIAAIPFTYFLPQYVWIPLIILGVTSFWGWLQYKDAQFAIAENFLVIQRRRIDKTKIIVQKKRIQALAMSQHRLQKYDDIASFTISLLGSEGLGSHYRIKHVTLEDAYAVGDWYSYRNEE